MAKVSIIITTYNYANYILLALNSVLNETVNEDIEVIVVDDGSIDDTEAVISRVGDSRIRYIYQPNKGKANATRSAIQYAAGDIIFNLDADDLFLDGKISETINIYKRFPDVVHVSSPALCLSAHDNFEYVEPIPVQLFNRPIDGSWLIEFFYNHKILYGGGSTFSARSSVLKKINIPDGVDMYIDEYLLLATLPHGKSYFIDHPLSVWRIHGENYSGNKKGLVRLKKNERLLKSSESVLHELDNLCLSSDVKKNYKLQHEVRRLSYKEDAGSKSLHDIMVFFCFICKSHYSLKILRHYSVFNRFIPTSVVSLLKRLR